MKASKVRWTLGTDGPATNNTLDLFSEMDFLFRTHRMLSESLTDISAKDVLEACTIRAAEAIQQQDRIGSLRPGKQADLAFVNLQSPHHLPIRDLESTLVLSGRAGDVTDVYVGGECLMEARKLKTLKESKILKDAQDFARKLDIPKKRTAQAG
jgi:5-methylthioadenosine/S-adenosylhomocysteine deaminase